MSDAPPPPLAERTLDSFTRRLGSTAITPGSGSAAAVTLALAAGCLRKAAVITLKRRDDPDLQRLADEAAALAAAALAGAEEEAESFRALLAAASHAVEEVLEVADGLTMCAAALLDLAERLEGRVEAVVAGDLLAARALTGAAQQILAANKAEAERARTAP
ncbi:cyclodeaminase/cyclohydrolase family protein [Phenylobacterium deserti]|uniref:Cyclodeaminase/cyclohydrolase domain-containing protein n=1 Tax=Phenylobacterium deserti TaxID=1914756 RepID=A0A328A870_9CAUL|nr:cyclodeaminase/cyclohydrolase family protein [Phenylobacterium deserti]RAK50783.1 hypothetical protein DJ018_18755 [Phenylobacterium deserti]